jgi:hypothetical protein
VSGEGVKYLSHSLKMMLGSKGGKPNVLGGLLHYF